MTTSTAIAVCPANPERVLLIITNLDATNPIFLGGTKVTASNGDRLAGGQSLVVDGVAATTAVSAIASGGTVVTSVMEVANP